MAKASDKKPMKVAAKAKTKAPAKPRVPRPAKVAVPHELSAEAEERRHFMSHFSG